MEYSILTEENFLLFAAKHYDNPQCCDDEEFNLDLKRLTYIKRLVNKYIETGILKERLIMNHLVILYNMFGPEATCKMVYLMNKKNMHVLKPFLIYLKILPEKIYGVGGENIIYTSSIEMDTTVIEALRKL